jgi:hypothetical protein
LGVGALSRSLLAAALVAAAPTVTGSAPAAEAAPRPVTVTLREYGIVLPAKLPPGPTTFVIRNRGRFPHNFTVLYGPVRLRSGTILPGATKRVTARLVPGEYLIGCTILNGGHLAQGMLTQFTIGSRAHGSGRWHYP